MTGPTVPCLSYSPDCSGTESVQSYFTGSFTLCKWLQTPVKAHQSKHNNSTHTRHLADTGTICSESRRDVPRNASVANISSTHESQHNTACWKLRRADNTTTHNV